MPAPLTIVIPTLNSAATLPAVLQSLMEGLASGLVRDLVVSDGGSVDATVKLADAAGACVVEGPASRGGQLKRGGDAARGRWLLFLHADTCLAEGWSAEVAKHIQNEECAAVFHLRFRATGLMPTLVAGWANLRTRMGLPYGDQGLLIRRDLHDLVGGFPDIPLMEDVAMARLLRGRIRRLPVEVTTGAERYEKEGWLRRGARNLYTLFRYFIGTDPESLARLYEKKSRN